MKRFARSLWISALIVVGAALAGCMSLRADLPEDAVREMARRDGADLAALCSHDGRSFSEGAILCMAGQRMICDPTGRWVQNGECGDGATVAAVLD